MVEEAGGGSPKWYLKVTPGAFLSIACTRKWKNPFLSQLYLARDTQIRLDASLSAQLGCVRLSLTVIGLHNARPGAMGNDTL